MTARRTPPIKATSSPAAEPGKVTPPVVDVWTLPSGDTVPKQVTLAPIPGKRDAEATVSFRDPNAMKAGDRKHVIRGIVSTNRAGQVVDLEDGILEVVISQWSFDLPIPAEAPQSIGQLEIEDRDRLAEYTAPVLELMFRTKD